MPEEEAKKKKERKKKVSGKRFAQHRGEKGKTTLGDFVAAFLAGGPQRFRDIVEHVGEKRTKAGFLLSPSFSGQVWHATKRVASPVKDKRGVWKLDKAKMKASAKASGNPKTKTPLKAKESEPEPSSEPEPEPGEEGEEDEGV